VKQDNSILLIGVIIIISVFYYIITSHENKVERMQSIIENQDETIHLQNDAILLLQKQNQYLLQFYYQQSSRADPLTPNMYD
jgi:hypothetical protein